MSFIDKNEIVEKIKTSKRKDLGFRLLETCFKLEISVPDMAQLLGVSPLTIIQWFKNKKIPVSHEEEVLKFLKVLSLKEEPKNKSHGNKKNSLNVNNKIITYDNGDIYEGNFVDGKRTGKGIYTWSEGGKWSGDVYEGDFDDGELTGIGILTYENGDIYEGNFDDGKRTGKGIYTWKNGDVYEGNFVDGKLTGKGIHTWSEGGKWSGYVYEGDFVDGKRTGKGILTQDSGDIYEGEWVDDEKTGTGTYTFADGDIYEGNIKLAYGQGLGKKPNSRKTTKTQVSQKLKIEPIICTNEKRIKYSNEFDSAEEMLSDLTFEKTFASDFPSDSIPVADRGKSLTNSEYKEYIDGISLDELDDIDYLLKANSLLDKFLKKKF